MTEQTERLIAEMEIEKKLNQVLEICRANAEYDWDNNMENAPEDEFKAIVKLIEEK